MNSLDNFFQLLASAPAQGLTGAATKAAGQASAQDRAQDAPGFGALLHSGEGGALDGLKLVSLDGVPDGALEAAIDSLPEDSFKGKLQENGTHLALMSDAGAAALVNDGLVKADAVSEFGLLPGTMPEGAPALPGLKAGGTDMASETAVSGALSLAGKVSGHLLAARHGGQQDGADAPAAGQDNGVLTARVTLLRLNETDGALSLRGSDQPLPQGLAHSANASAHADDPMATLTRFLQTGTLAPGAGQGGTGEQPARHGATQSAPEGGPQTARTGAEGTASGDSAPSGQGSARDGASMAASGAHPEAAQGTQTQAHTTQTQATQAQATQAQAAQEHATQAGTTPVRTAQGQAGQDQATPDQAALDADMDGDPDATGADGKALNGAGSNESGTNDPLNDPRAQAMAEADPRAAAHQSDQAAPGTQANQAAAIQTPGGAQDAATTAAASGAAPFGAGQTAAGQPTPGQSGATAASGTGQSAAPVTGGLDPRAMTAGNHGTGDRGAGNQGSGQQNTPQAARLAAGQSGAESTVPRQTGGDGGAFSRMLDSGSFWRPSSEAGGLFARPSGMTITPESLTGMNDRAGMTGIAAGLASLSGQPNPARAAGGQALGGQPRGQTAKQAAHDLGLKVSSAADKGEKQFTMRMDPPELGRVLVQLQFTDRGLVRAQVRTEKPETLDMLQKDRGTLERAIEAGGHKLDPKGLAFTLDDPTGEESAGRAMAEAALADKHREEAALAAAQRGADEGADSGPDIANQSTTAPDDGEDVDLDAILGHVNADTGLDIRI
ncbi:flagellar hook-length control protein FliK [Yunchengibacter salinarum]|uniref:flagellar hook-length control protein FliK n=1 Tax=Yunchengibacter salinarum TaxID=3133399 RepID=UPI0035B5C166